MKLNKKSPTEGIKDNGNEINIVINLCYLDLGYPKIDVSEVYALDKYMTAILANVKEIEQ